MKQKINTQLEIIEKSLKWVKKTESMSGAKGREAYYNLVTHRWKLNNKKKALESNPAAAMYGESQAGKSYLVGSLLSEGGAPFKIFDGDNNQYDFKLDINPRGNEIESTSVVTRFSTKHKTINKDYPVVAKMLSPTDIIIILCEAYYNNLQATKTTPFEVLKDKVEFFENEYKDKEVCQKWIVEDNVMFDIKYYFSQNFSATVYHNIEDAGFFEKVPSIITKVPYQEWKDVFSLLWNSNKQITKLFNDLINKYKEINFVDTMYLPIDAVLREKGTILDVSRLDELYGSFKGDEPNYTSETKVLYRNNEGKETSTIFSKPYLCALAAEIIFILPEGIIQNKQFLEKTDLLDFPGIRRFENTNEENITNEALTKLLRRGRVDYLFNKYSNSEQINVLLFCQKHSQSGQSVMPNKLNNWINKMIGDSPEERELYQSSISPLFVISTWFNKDLEYDFNTDKPNNRNSLDARWNQRFVKVLEDEIFKIDTFNWLNNWTTSQPNFQNIFLLRDFDQSSETNSQIYKGYNHSKIENEEIIPENYPGFRKDLRQSFIEYDFVQQHFENPGNSWDRAVSINQDGSELIIEQLTIAANSINGARYEKSTNELKSISESTLSELKKYYHDSDSDALLQRAKSTAGNIQVSLDIAFGRDPYFFGSMMKEFMLNESDVYDLYLEQIRDIERRDLVDMDKYSAIRMAVSELNANDSFDANVERLRIHYEKPSNEECQQDFEEKGIDLNELFYGNHQRVMNFSDVLAKALEKYWFEQYMLENQENLAEIFSESGLQDIQDMLQRLFEKLKITELIASKIRRYVGYHNIEDAYEMIADISAEIVNKFINTVGIEYFSESDFDDLKIANEKNKLGLVLDHDELQFKENTRSEAAELITQMGNLDEILNKNPLPSDAKRLPNYRSYIIWRDFMKVGFVFLNDIPNYDVQANNKLKVIIDQCKEIQF